MEFSSSSTSSDEEIFDLISEIERPRNFRQRENQFEKYNDAEFRDRFRLSKETVNVLVDVLYQKLEKKDTRISTLTVGEEILIALRFYATGSFQILIGDDSNVHKTTVCRIVQKVSKEIATLRPHFIKMPATEQEINEVKSGFHAIRGFPNVVGCIDGCHIPIISPGGEHAELFRNRKGYFSINVQCICDHNLMIRDIDARWRGSTHDSTIFNASRICGSFEENMFPNSYLLGDSAYSCQTHLLTPLLNANSQPELNYNAAHIQTRNSIERAFGVWKRRFACLSMGLRSNINTTLTVIVATAVLNNIAIQNRDRYNEEPVAVVEQPNVIRNAENSVAGNALRKYIINTYFT